jgi:chemotaxis protein methyltransferase CheR
VNSLPDVTHIERFRTFITRRFGLQFDDSKLTWLGEVLKRRAGAAAESALAYLARTEAEFRPDERAALAQELTIGETYFFRHLEQFNALRDEVMPARLRANASTRRLRMLSAGCASGEEAYSMAMTCLGLLPDASWSLSIDALDLSPAAVERARRARYSSWSLRETPPAAQQRWFRADGRDLVLDDGIRQAVRFEERNLLDDDPGQWVPNAYDVIFCRNVLMYFAPQAARSVVERLTKSLAPGGYLFLGHAETLRGLSNDHHLRHTSGCFYYQRKEAADTAHDRIDVRATSQPVLAGPALTAAVEGADSWVEAIDRATDRIRSLSLRARQERSAGPVRSGRNWPLDGALDLLRRERFAEALSLVQALPAESGGDPEVLLLRAVLLVHGGRLQQAEDTCRALLGIDALNAGAYYVLALCREGEGDARAAADHDQAAAYLDPAFSMPRLHLGLMARRSGDREAQRRELSQALCLLEREDASRLLLFGGGFSRDSLITLCRAELRAAGGGA